MWVIRYLVFCCEDYLLMLPWTSSIEHDLIPLALRSDYPVIGRSEKKLPSH